MGAATSVGSARLLSVMAAGTLTRTCRTVTRDGNTYIGGGPGVGLGPPSAGGSLTYSWEVCHLPSWLTW